MNNESESQLQRLVDRLERVAEIGTWQMDVATGGLIWSDQTRRIHEVPPDFEPVLEQGISFYEEGDSRTRIAAAVEKCIETGEGWDLELTLITATGRRIWVRALGEADYEQGVCVRLFGVFQDVTRQHELMASLNREKERLELVLEGSGLGLWDWNPKTDAVTFDEGWYQMLGFQPDEIGSRLANWAHILHPDDREATEAAARDHIVGSTSHYDTVQRLRHKHGHWIFVRTRGQIVTLDSAGRPARFAGTYEDVTRHETAALQRRQIYAMTAHELRTPLSALEMMSATDSPSEWWDYRPLFQSTINEAFHTLDDMRMLINPELRRPVRAEAILLPRFNQALVGLTTSVVTKNHFKLDLTDTIPSAGGASWFEFDTYRVRATLVNLIKNACIHSRGSHVQVCSSLVTVGDEQRLIWTIDDDGIGIDEDALANLFEPYTRGDTHAEGTGMGLYIARLWLGDIGGELTYQRLAQGSRFQVSIPAITVQPPEQAAGGNDIDAAMGDDGAPAVTATIAGLSVLFVEDDRMLSMLGRKILTKLGANVDVASDGQEAFERLGGGYDLILTDYYMPRMTGEELLREARAAGYAGPMVVLTAASLDDETELLVVAGADEVLIKPLTEPMLLGLVERLLQQGKLPSA